MFYLMFVSIQNNLLFFLHFEKYFCNKCFQLFMTQHNLFTPSPPSRHGCGHFQTYFGTERCMWVLSGPTVNGLPGTLFSCDAARYFRACTAQRRSAGNGDQLSPRAT